MEFPRLFRVRQKFARPRVEDPAAEVESQLARLQLQNKIRPGQSVAISVGSRGIANIRFIVRAMVRHLQGLGAKPLIVPAMGSHGGATAEGQQAVLTGYGVTEEFCGCPIRSSMETVVVCRAAEGFPVHFDRIAFESDHVLVAGRVKPHTDFVGDIESGLMKMLLIGLGKLDGANIYHRAIHDYNFPQIVRSVASEVLKRCRIVAGLAIVENAYDETAKIEAIAPEEIEEREKALLVLAKQWLPRLPFQEVDLLIVDQIGKNLSGAGMDSNVTGRKFNDHAATDADWAKVRRIAVRGLTEATHGNGIGIGMSEFCLTRAVEQTDQRITWINALTSGHISAAMYPLDYPNDRLLLEAALPTIGLREPPEARIVWIKNTLELAEVECAECFWEQAQQRDDLEVIEPSRPMPLDASGMLPDFVLPPNH